MARVATIFRLEQAGARARVIPLAVPAREPLRLGPDGGVARRGRVAASIVPHLRGGSRRAGFALVAWPEAPRVAIGARGIVGVAPLRHRYHVFVGACELLFSTDALPAVVAVDPPASCGHCLEAVGGAQPVLRECPRCGLRACDACWSRFPGARCTTAGCGQPAALERELWAPRLDEFATAPPELAEATR